MCQKTYSGSKLIQTSIIDVSIGFHFAINDKNENKVFGEFVIKLRKLKI